MDYYTKVIKDYAVFSGRARRKEYWMFTLINVLICIVLSIVFGIVSETISSIALTLYGLAVLVPSLALAVRRLHDTSRSAWWLLIALIPFIGSIVLLVFMILDSTPGSNEYGPNPKGEGAVATAATPVSPVEPPQNPTV